MAKKSKLQRTHERRLRELRSLRQENARLREETILLGAGMDSTQRLLSARTHELDRVKKTVADICAHSTALEASDRVRYCHQLTIPMPGRINLRDFQRGEESLTYRAIDTEEMVVLLLRDYELQEAMQRHIHLRIENLPGDFTVGYAISRTAVRSMHHPEHLVELVCRQFGHAIWKAMKK